MKKLNKRNLISAYARWLYITKAFRTDKKIIVIESDDWGSIRTSNKEAYNTLTEKGYNMEKSPYSLDALETNEDLTALYETLKTVKDTKENPACFTANMIMANPDFDAILQNNYSKYVYEPVGQTLEKYEGRDQVRSLWKQGMNSRIFFPQLHAREHVRYWDWMRDIKAGEEEARETFELKMCGVPRVVSRKGKSYFHPPYIDDSTLQDVDVDLDILISEGAALFEKEFGFRSKTVIAPNCGWTDSTERIWERNDIDFIQGGFIQEYHKSNAIKYISHYLGEKSKTKDLIYLVRNCTFEPSRSNNPDYWKSTFSEVNAAFRMKTPAIISSHRVNYIGAIKKENREKSLEQLNLLLKEIKKKWPDVLFLNSAELGQLIINSKSLTN